MPCCVGAPTCAPMWPGSLPQRWLGRGGQARAAARLGARERQVLKLVAEGCTSNQIAEMLGIAPSTVDVHRRNIMRKLDRHSVAELTRYVINNERGVR